MKYNTFFCMLSLVLFSVSQLKAQWSPNTATPTDDINRTGVTGIGFVDETAAATAANGETRFLVNGTGSDGGILAHYVSGSVGSFSGKWCGLGIGNPGGAAGTPKPYGLAIADTGSVGFYNIIREVFEGATRKNTVAGFGAEGSNINRFIVRAYSDLEGAITVNGADYPSGAYLYDLLVGGCQVEVKRNGVEQDVSISRQEAVS